MKRGVFLLLICSLLFNLANMIALQRHEEVLNSHEMQEQNHQNHEFAQAVITAAAQKGAEVAVTKLMQNPADAAKIPSRFVQGQVQGLIEIFQGSWNIKSRARSLQLTFDNLSNRKVIFEDAYFDSGIWYQAWMPVIPPKFVCQGTVANRQGSWLCGVTGGIRLRIDGTNIRIYLGFNNPYIGGFKHFGELSYDLRNAKYGYQKSQNINPKSSSLGNFYLEVINTESSIAHNAFIYTLANI